MFANCCGRSKKASTKERKRSMRDAETQSTSDLLATVETSTQSETPLPHPKKEAEHHQQQQRKQSITEQPGAATIIIISAPDNDDNINTPAISAANDDDEKATTISADDDNKPPTISADDENKPATISADDENKPLITSADDENKPSTISADDDNKSSTISADDKNKPSTTSADDDNKPGTISADDENKPSTTSADGDATPPTIADDDKRPSVVSVVKIEIENDDDDVFHEGVGPPIKLNQNLGTPEARGKGLPMWFSQEDEDDDDDDDFETGGTQEPPATPIGKDELALRRHRFFSELLSAAQNAIDHKVHFDPLGPVVAEAAADLQATNELETIVNRLENITTRLESVYAPVKELLELTCSSPSPAKVEEPPSPPPTPPLLPPPPLPPPPPDFFDIIVPTPLPAVDMSVQTFQYIIDGPLAQFVAVSNKIGGEVALHCQMVLEAFQTQYQYVKLATEVKQPSQNEINSLMIPIGKCIMKIQEYREAHRASPFFNHLSAISESIPALGWVAVSPAPAPYIKEMNDAGQFYTNRVLKEWKEKDPKHKDWVNAWIQTLTELQAFVKQYHTTGIVWSGKGAAPAAGCPPPPPPGCPPPPPAMGDFSSGMDVGGNDRSALFAQINQGENITKGLKKVTSEMQTHKNPTIRQGPAPFKAPTGGSSSAVGYAGVDKPPSFTRDGKKWLIEYQKGNPNLVVDGAEMNNVVYVYKCSDSTVQVKGKINSITLDSCKKTSVVFDNVVSCIEFINCQSVQMQVLGKVPTVSIDKTDGCQVYLSSQALDVEIVSSKSSEMNILVPTPSGDYVEYPVPEQFKTTVVPGKGLSTLIVENKG